LTNIKSTDTAMPCPYLMESTHKFNMESTHKFNMESTHKFNMDLNQSISRYDMRGSKASRTPSPKKL